MEKGTTTRSDRPTDNATQVYDPEAFDGLTTQALARGCSIRFTARGGSMRPFILDGDVLTIAPLGSDDVRAGDVVLYRQLTNRLGVHRVLRARPGTDLAFAIRGDATAGPCERIPPSHIFGKAITRERNGRTVRIDSAWRRSLSMLWARAHPLSAALLCLAVRTRNTLRQHT